MHVSSRRKQGRKKLLLLRRHLFMLVYMKMQILTFKCTEMEHNLFFRYQHLSDRRPALEGIDVAESGSKQTRLVSIPLAS